MNPYQTLIETRRFALYSGIQSRCIRGRRGLLEEWCVGRPWRNLVKEYLLL